MVTEAKFKHALKEMMAEMPLEDINVTSLCKRCDCHRQTFYYHFQDIYDLIAAIFLNESMRLLDKAKSAKESIKALLNYAKENFAFLRSTYNSAARDLTDDFLFGKINAKLLSLWGKDETLDLKIEGKRSVARRFAHFVADEFGYCFKDPKLTPEKFSRRMSKFADSAVTIILPELFALSKKEEAK